MLLCVKDSIQYKIRPDLHMEQDFTENIFIEIESQCLNTSKNVIIEYQIPIQIFLIRDYQTFYKKLQKKTNLYILWVITI